MSRNYSFRVPAGTSNLGAGFDTLGLALEIYLRVRVEPAAKTEIVALGVDSAEIPTTSDNLILRVANRVAALRTAFMAATQDPELLAEAKKLRVEVGPLSGEEIQALVNKMYSLPREVVDRTREALVYKPPK